MHVYYYRSRTGLDPSEQEAETAVVVFVVVVVVLISVAPRKWSPNVMRQVFSVHGFSQNQQS